MGWWGEGVMEGDQPMDVVGAVEQALLNREMGEDPTDAERIIMHDMLKTEEGVKTALAAIDLTDPINVQALGYMVMLVGGTIQPFKDLLLAAIDHDESQDFTDPEARMAVMKSFREKVVSYDGTPIKNETRGLLDMLMQTLFEAPPPPSAAELAYGDALVAHAKVITRMNGGDIAAKEELMTTAQAIAEAYGAYWAERYGHTAPLSSSVH